MVYRNKIQPLNDINDNDNKQSQSIDNNITNDYLSQKDVTDLDSLSTVGLEESSYLKLRPFSRLDPTIVRLLTFLNCFGLFVNFSQSTNRRMSRFSLSSSNIHCYSNYLKIFLMILIIIVSGEVVYDVNLRQSKLLAEQKRSTPLLTFVIVAYSWLSLVIPIICDLSLLFIGSLLFRFYSRTTATVCNGIYFGKKASVDSWYYYLTLVLIAFLDAFGQVIVLGVWPESIDPYMKMFVLEGGLPITSIVEGHQNLFNPVIAKIITKRTATNTSLIIQNNSSSINIADNTSILTPVANDIITPHTLLSNSKISNRPIIKTYILDYLLGEEHAHGDLGVCIKLICLMIQFIHSYAFFIIIISLAHHYASVINHINKNLDKYEFRRLLKQLIILRDSSEQISLMISLPFSCMTILVFIRAIALNGVIIQSTMLAYENWAVSLQAFTCTVSIIMVFIYCDGLQSASKQTHRLKTEHTVINENKGGNQSIYEFLDYLNRLSKSIRITFCNIIAINKSSLVGLFGHILTLTFVTS